MALALVPYALTSLTRVKNRLSISGSTEDTLLTQLINEASAFAQSYCERNFLEQTYTNEVYSGGDGCISRLYLKQAPVSSLSAFQERQGTISASTWSAVNADWYELLDAGSTGMIQTLGYLNAGFNNYRVTYQAGYKIDFTNEGNLSLHTLPIDLTGAIENMVAQIYYTRRSKGIKQESLGNHSVTFSDLLTDENGKMTQDALTIRRYKRVQM